MKRCFVALSLPENVLNELARIQEELKVKDLFEGKFVSKENMHLTLKFLGEISEEKVEEVKKRLVQINCEEFKVKLAKAGVFTPEAVRVIWVKLEGVEELQKKVDEALKDLFGKEFRFMSHLTVARVKSIMNKKKLLDFLEQIKIKPIEFEVNFFSLMESKLFSENPKYEIIEEYILEKKYN